MPRKKSPIDRSEFTGTLATCPHCKWRQFATSPAWGWYALAHHLKHHHDDMHASQNAKRYFHRLRQSEKHHPDM